MFQTILVPTDFSENSKNAINYTLSLFANRKVNLVLLNTYQVPVMNTDVPIFMPDVMEDIERDANDKLNALCKSVREKNKEISCEPVLQYGDLNGSIETIVSEKKIDLIAMGTHGASGLKKFFLGSNTATIIGRSNCPVLAIPENVSFNPLNKIGFATDYVENDLKALSEIKTIASYFNSEIVIVHIYEKEEDRIEFLMEWYENMINRNLGYPKISYHLLSADTVENGLKNFIADYNIGMLAMLSRKRSFWKKLFSSSHTKNMAYEMTVPLLAFKGTNEREVFDFL